MSPAEIPGSELGGGEGCLEKGGSVWQALWGAVFGLVSRTVCTNEQEEGVALVLMNFADTGGML